MITSINGNIMGYFYRDGYLRTTSKQFTIKNLNDKTIHLTNDAIQKFEEDYGKFEYGNKLSFGDFNRYIQTHHSDLNILFERDILPQIESIITDTVVAVYKKIDLNKRMHSFEIFGYDFMLDHKLKV